MADTNFEKTIRALNRQQDSKSLLKILTAIRKQVEWPKHKQHIVILRAKGGLIRLVSLLQMTNKNILDVSLSILGNCMMDKGSARDAVNTFSILSALNRLIKRSQKEDSINGRVFRIIGNICYHKHYSPQVIMERKSQLITYTVEFINKISKDELSEDTRYSEATIIMAIRVLRTMLNKYTFLPLVTKFGVLKAIGALFIKMSKEWQEKKENENILRNIIRLLRDYSEYKYYDSIIEMRNTDRGDSLLHLSNVLLLSPMEIVGIIMNFINMSQLESELPVPEICDKFIDAILATKFSTEEFDNDCVKYIECLCYLLKNPANRKSDRCGKCLPILIKVLDSFTNPTGAELRCCLLILTTLKDCQYNEHLIQEQLRYNLIEVLLKKLQWVVGSSDMLNVKHKMDNKRKLYTSSSPSKRFRVDSQPMPPTLPCIFDYIQTEITSQYLRSPSPCSSIGSDFSIRPWPSTSSPAGSSYCLSESDSDDYSPVCSEADSDEYQLSNGITIVSDDNLPEVVVPSYRQEEIPKEESGITNLKVTLITKIAIMVKIFAAMQPTIQQLGRQDLLLALLKCSEHFETTLTANIDTLKIVNLILLYNQFLIPLMKTKFIDIVYDLKQMQHPKKCQKCADFFSLGDSLLTKITLVAESGAGKGDIAHTLLRGTNKTKEQLVLVIPYVIKDSNILTRLMINCGGLKTLMRVLKMNTDFLRERAVKALYTLAKEKLMIANPKSVTIKLPKKMVIKDLYEIDKDCNNVVTFKLDDGETVKADREFLSQKSEFFSSLLYGKFKESQEDLISLHKVNSRSFHCLLQLLKSMDNVEMVDLRIRMDLDTLLDVIVLSDRFLLADLCSSLINNVESFKISSKTVPHIYKWSLNSGTDYLRVESIAFALVGEMDNVERFTMFTQLLGLGFTNELVDDIEKLLARYFDTIKTSN